MRRLKRIMLRVILALLTSSVLISLLMVVPFRWLNPPVTMVMVDRWLRAESEAFTLQRHWLEWDEIPPHVALAVVTAEDQRFPLHSGFDFRSIEQALRESDRRGNLRGASTISQQVARNLFLWTGRSWLRKGLEAWFTILIEISWDKRRILEVYLNIAEWGEGVFGIEAASRHHFRVPAAQLRPMQAALLASSLPGPLIYDPARPSPRLRERAEWNLEQQRRLGGIQWLAPL